MALRAAKANAVVDEIKKAGGQAIGVGGDVTAPEYPKKLVNATIECVPLASLTRSPQRRDERR